MAMAGTGTGGSPWFLVESWGGGGSGHVLAVAQGRSGACAAIVRVGVSDRLWEVAQADLAPVAGHADGDALRALMVPLLRPACNGEARPLGLLGGPSELHLRLCAVAVEGLRSAGSGKSLSLDAVLDRYRRFGNGPGGMALDRRPGDWGYPGNDSYLVHDLTGARGIEGVGPAPPGLDALPDGLGPVEAYGAVERAVAAALDAMQVPIDREAAALLGPRNWSATAHAWLAAPDEAGHRRRQAARLHPAFVPLLASTASLGMKVDAGRPYEWELLDILRGALPAGLRDGLTAAHLRRLRTLPASSGFAGLADALDAAARLPVDWLPGDAAGWKAMEAALSGVMAHVRGTGLDLATLFGGKPYAWSARGRPADEARVDAAFALQPVEAGRHREALRARDPSAVAMALAADAVRRLEETLVGPTLRSMDAAGEVAWSEGTDGYGISARLLLGGRTLAAVDRLQARWHDGGPRQDGLLPCAGTNAWPRAFPDFVAANGLTVTCLADEAALKAEGMRGPDPDGFEGLDHCVGGYGLRCYVGECQVASVRRPDGTRVSTVAFEHHLPEGGARLRAAEHLALRNGDPSPEAEAAVRELVAAVRAGQHPVDLAAFGRRDLAGFREGYDWRDAGALDRAFAAWEPYLPRAVARGGLAALRGWLAREAGAAPRCPPRESDGFALEDPVDVRGGPP